MTLSDLEKPAATWAADPLLNAKSNAPQYSRKQWDEKSVQNFGPWRMGQKVEPTLNQSAAFVPAIAPTDAAHSEPTGEAALLEPHPMAEILETVEAQLSESALNALREEAYQRGLEAGMAQAEQQLQEERQHERELFRHLTIELRSLNQDPQRFFEPLKRLALHIAEQWVRGELQISGQAIDQLIRQCLDQLDPAGEKVHVDLNPADLERLQKLGEQATADLELQADPQLREGSVRVRLNESVVQDLIEHRVEAMARKLLQQPESWLQSSALLHPDKVTPLESPDVRRHWTQPTQDVQEAEIKEVQPPTDEEASP